MTARRIFLSLIFTCCGLLACPMHVHALDKDKEKDKEKDAPKSEKVRFNTVDGVELHGNFYPAQAKKRPVVLMLHAVGEDSRSKNWVSLAEELQKSGLNVLTFDFRGHGQSIEVDKDKFWDFEWLNPATGERIKYNKFYAGTKLNVGKLNISYKNFDNRYFPALINDIAAARSYLERTKNDDGICKTSSIIIIGADSGGTLGASWMAAEWFRFRINPPVLDGGEPTIDMRPEGKDIIGAIFLSMNVKLANRKVRVDKVIHVPGVKGNTAMMFMHGDEDVPGKTLANFCEKYLKKEEKNKFTFAYPIKGTKLVGAGLLQEAFGTEKLICEYVTELVDAKENEWSARDFKKAAYCWRIPAGAGIPDVLIQIKQIGELNLAFDTYEKFVP